jgi:hypothetical protein
VSRHSFLMLLLAGAAPFSTTASAAGFADSRYAFAASDNETAVESELHWSSPFRGRFVPPAMQGSWHERVAADAKHQGLPLLMLSRGDSFRISIGVDPDGRPCVCWYWTPPRR